jgi:DNA-binding transcriptional LysR family regulator
MSNVARSDMLTLRDTSGNMSTASIVGRYRVDLALALREALAAGRGIGHAHQWLVDDLLSTGQLEHILPEYHLPEVPLNMLIVPERAQIARVRLFVDFILKNVKAVPGIR